VHKINLCLVQEKHSYRILYEEKHCKECIKKKNARRARSISSSRNPSNYEFEKIPESQYVCGMLKYSKRSRSEGITQILQKSKAYSNYENSKEG
jgi:hypothetical protein